MNITFGMSLDVHEPPEQESSLGAVFTGSGGMLDLLIRTWLSPHIQLLRNTLLLPELLSEAYAGHRTPPEVCLYRTKALAAIIPPPLPSGTYLSYRQTFKLKSFVNQHIVGHKLT